MAGSAGMTAKTLLDSRFRTILTSRPASEHINRPDPSPRRHQPQQQAQPQRGYRLPHQPRSTPAT
jgi:hypothetical protein